MPGIIPRDVYDRLLAAPETAVAQRRAIAVRYAGAPVVERHVEPGYSKWPGEHDVVLRSFIVQVPPLGRRRPHDELSGWDDDHLWAVLGAFLESVARFQTPLGLRIEHMGTHLRQHVRADH